MGLGRTERSEISVFRGDKPIDRRTLHASSTGHAGAGGVAGVGRLRQCGLVTRRR